MAEFRVALKDRNGFDICEETVEGAKAARARAIYLLSEEHADMIGTSHDTLETFKVEVQAIPSGECLWDRFFKAA